MSTFHSIDPRGIRRDLRSFDPTDLLRAEELDRLLESLRLGLAMEERAEPERLLAGDAEVERRLAFALILSKIGTASLRRTRTSYASR